MRAWVHRMREDRTQGEEERAILGRLEEPKKSHMISLIN